jgi:hypothetical protein
MKDWIDNEEVSAEGVGLGDVVHAIAQPFATAVDRVIQTRLSECYSCRERRRQLNELLSMRRGPFRGSNW